MQIRILDSIQQDVLKEIGNIGSGNATTALSALINERIEMSVPDANLYELKDMTDIIERDDQEVVGIWVPVSGDFEANMLFFMEKPVARYFVNCMFGTQYPDTQDFSEMELSALKEIGNIIIGNYVTSISTMTQMKIQLSVPNLCIDMLGAILSLPMIASIQLDDCALFIQSRITDDFDVTRGYLIMLPTGDSFGKLMKALGVE